MKSGQGQLTLTEWHARFTQQAGWTAEIRRHLFDQAGLKPGSQVLEVGCGTGAVLNAIAEETDYHLTGVDIDRPSLQFNHTQLPPFPLTQADGHSLPFADKAFDAVYCHYLLLWVADPARVLAEMRRVTRPGGVVIALAEPDYAGRIDSPPPLDELGRLQTKALARQGADVEIGRKLEQLFISAGLVNIFCGQLTARADQPETMDPLEKAVLKSDLAGGLTAAEVDHYLKIDETARSQNRRKMSIPTFHAIAWVSP